MKLNKFDRTGECFTMGQSAENAFLTILKTKGRAEIAQKKDQFRHIDYILHLPKGGIATFEVKARKKTSRGDEDVNDDLIWIEWVGVTGKTGWIEGDATYICFERENDFLIVNRKKLKETCVKLCKDSVFVKHSSQALYHFYQRRDRQDVLSLVKMSDIAPIADEIWKK